MTAEEVKAKWGELCNEIQIEARYRAITFPNAAGQIEKEAEEFCNRPVPKVFDELSARISEWNLIHIKWGGVCLGGFGFESA